MKGILEALQNPNSKRDLNRSLFDRIAGSYHVATRVLSLGRDEAWKTEAIRSLPIDQPSLCVDLATGTGDLVARLRCRFPRAQIVGLDLSGEMVRRARERFAGVDGLEIREGDMSQLPFEDESADVVTGGYALRNGPDLGVVLREVHRILKPDGVGCFLDFVQPRPGARRWFYHSVLHGWGGLVGLILHGRPWIYRYIPASLSGFPDEEELPVRLERAGLLIDDRRRFFGGMVECITLRKIPNGSSVLQPSRKDNH